jgi:hypothetical protein
MYSNGGLDFPPFSQISTLGDTKMSRNDAFAIGPVLLMVAYLIYID